MSVKNPDSQQRKSKHKDEMPRSQKRGPSLIGGNDTEKYLGEENSVENKHIVGQTKSSTSQNPYRYETPAENCDKSIQAMEDASPSSGRKKDYEPTATTVETDKAIQTPQDPDERFQEGHDQRNWKNKHDILQKEASSDHQMCVAEIKSLRRKLEASRRHETGVESQLSSPTTSFQSELGRFVYPVDVNRRYQGIYWEISFICRDLAAKTSPSTILRIAQHPKYWPIGDFGKDQRVERFLKTDTFRSKTLVLERMVLGYIMRQLFKPMLVGIDREAEGFLLGLEKNIESRMIPSASDTWISKALHAYSLLPAYRADREHFLQSRLNTLQGCFEYLARSSRDEELNSTATRETLEEELRSIMEKTADFVSEMSFSYSKHEIGWDYCDQKKELTARELQTHDIQTPDGIRLNYQHFRKFSTDEKVADVVMFVRPPIFGSDRISCRMIWGKPLVIAEPVSGYDPNPPRRKNYLDLLEEMEESREKQESSDG